MRTLVTGGTGFTGTALVQRLLKQGHDVIALDYKEGLRTDALRRAGARVIIGSVTDPQIMKEALRGVDVVHHLAAAFREMNVPKEHYDRVNINGAQITLDAAVSAGARRFIYCSTCGVHGNVDVTPADENSPIQPADYYQRSKYLAEPIMQLYAQEGTIETVILRPAAIYGPGDLERFAMIYRQAAKGWFPMFGSGDVNYHPNYVDNLVDAFVLAQDADSKVNGRAYLIADESYLSIKDLVRRVGIAIGVDVKIRHYPLLPARMAAWACELICRPLRIAPPIFPRRIDWYRQNRAFSIQRARSELGYEPHVSIDEGLRQTGLWYAQEGVIRLPNAGMPRAGLV